MTGADMTPACAHCGATTTTRNHWPMLLAWFCAGDDGETCDTRKRQAQP